MADSHEKLTGTIQYLGVKFVHAKPMTLGRYNEYRGWPIPADEDPATEGYIVQYPDMYVSWCPKGQFEEANRSATDMSFGHAIEAMKKGLKVARAGWNGCGMFACIGNASCNSMKAPALAGYFDNDEVPYRACFYLKTAQDDVAAWAPSTSDALADDWCIVE